MLEWLVLESMGTDGIIKRAVTLHRTTKPAITAGFITLEVWSRRESNPRPNIFAESFLHVYLRISVSEPCQGRN